MAFLTSTKLDQLLNADSTLTPRHRKTLANSTTSSASTQSPTKIVARPQPPPRSRPQQDEGPTLPTPPMLAPNLSPLHRRPTITKGFLPKKTLVGPDPHPATPPIHSSISDFFIHPTDSPPLRPAFPASPLHNPAPAGLSPISVSPTPNSAHARPPSPTACERICTPSPPDFKGSIPKAPNRTPSPGLVFFPTDDPLASIVKVRFKAT